jgi:hypothetical protein
MKKIVLFFAFLLPFYSIGQETQLPENEFFKGWKKHDETRYFVKSNLFDYIDGGADLFLEFGFAELIVQHYSDGQNELGLEMYRMESPEAALGIYLMKRGQESPHPDVPARNSADRLQFAILKNSYFILINNFEGVDSLIPVMVELAREILGTIQEGNEIEILTILPKDNLIEGSELIIRGPVALLPIYTFGDADILQLKGKIFGAVGDYKDSEGHVYTQIVIPYPTQESARDAYRHLLNNLDSYLKIIKKSPASFVFKDYKRQFGLVQQDSHILTIRIHLKEIPH